ncbi:MAG: hypothetical protein AAFR17_11720 [Pseudomonadota bacterium]
MSKKSKMIAASLIATALTGQLSGASKAQSAAEFGDAVLNIAQSELQEWITDPVIVFAIREQNQLHAGLNERRIKRLDKRWVAGGSYGPMVGDLLGRQASVILRDRRERSNGLINEIIVMDAFGMNVAISDATSDFFQGDEAKWLETYLKGPDAVHIGEIEFDDSTQKDQSQVSLTVTDPETGTPIGAVTFGIDVGIALARGS